MGIKRLTPTSWLKNPSAQCNPPAPFAHPTRLVLLGAPGVGKGTQASLLSRRLGACHLSTGDMLRAIKNLPKSERTPAIMSALDCMEHGDLVPDKIVLQLIGERLKCLRCDSGFLLDGFPRTVSQAEAFEKTLKHLGISLDAVLNYELPMEKIVARLSGRVTCPGCRAVFHIEALAPKVSGICDYCGGLLQKRNDDYPEAIKTRMKNYQTSTAPLIKFYDQRGLLRRIHAVGTPEEIFERGMQALGREASLARV